MLLNRRGFLGSLLGGIAAAVVDPERLIWQPGKKLISIPPPRLYRPNQFLTVQEITTECLLILERELQLLPRFYRMRLPA